MSILIKGMAMPTSCFYCPFRRKVDPDNIMCIVTRECFEETYAGTIETRNRGNCPLVPVPDHGRLIDGDALIKRMIEEGWADGCGWADALDIATAPTVIPGEDGAE